MAKNLGDERDAASYELYVFDVEQVADVDGARLAFEEAPYYDRSRPLTDGAARKWRVARALQSSERELSRVDGGDDSSEDRRYLQLAHHDAQQSLRLDVFDEAVEIVLELPAQSAGGREAVARLIRCLSCLQREGFAHIYDPQLDRQLDIEADEDAVVASLGAHGARDSERGSSTFGGGATTVQGPGASPRPWWKIW